MPSRLCERPQLDALADALVVELPARDSCDGNADFAQHLPVSFVSRLVGLPETVHERQHRPDEEPFHYAPCEAESGRSWDESARKAALRGYRDGTIFI